MRNDEMVALERGSGGVKVVGSVFLVGCGQVDGVPMKMETGGCAASGGWRRRPEERSRGEDY